MTLRDKLPPWPVWCIIVLVLMLAFVAAHSPKTNHSVPPMDPMAWLWTL